MIKTFQLIFSHIITNNKNTKIPTKEVFSSKNNYCADVDHSTGNLLIYNTNVEGECEILH